MKFQQSFCVVDSSLRLLWVGGDWDDFARRNAGERALAANVLATTLCGHITDIRTADKVAEMVRTVIRLKRPLKMEYRCDSPDEMRRFRLTIQPLKDDRVVMVHDLRDAITLDNPMQVWTFDPNARAEKCSMCGAVHVGQGHAASAWIDPLESQNPHPERVRYTLCGVCEARADAAIHAAMICDVPEDELVTAIKAGVGLG